MRLRPVRYLSIWTCFELQVKEKLTKSVHIFFFSIIIRSCRLKNFKKGVWLDSSFNKITYFKWDQNQPGNKAKYACSHRGTGKWLTTDGSLNLDVFCVNDRIYDKTKQLNKTSIVSNSSSDLQKHVPKYTGAQLVSVNNFVNRTLERLKNFNRILDIKIEKLNDSRVAVQFNRRMIFLFPDVSNIEAYIEQKLKDKKKQDQLKNAKLVIKMIAALVMSISFLLIARIMTKIVMIKVKRLKLSRSKKEKGKNWAEGVGTNGGGRGWLCI